MFDGHHKNTVRESINFLFAQNMERECQSKYDTSVVFTTFVRIDLASTLPRFIGQVRQSVIRRPLLSVLLLCFGECLSAFRCHTFSIKRTIDHQEGQTFTVVSSVFCSFSLLVLDGLTWPIKSIRKTLPQ